MSKLLSKRKVKTTRPPRRLLPDVSEREPEPVKKVRKSKKDDESFARGLVTTVRARLRKGKLNEENIRLLSDGNVLSEVTEWIPTGFCGLDYILGGGWAVGRASEVYGAEAAGKSALAHRAVKACQDNGGTAVFLDFETSLDPSKMDQLGIDPDRLVYASPETIEEAWDIIWSTLDYLENNPPKAPTLIVWDSIAASVPRAELEEKSSGDCHIGLIARSMSKGARKMFRRIAKVRAHMLWVNQERAAIGNPYAEATTPGGKAVRYAASMRVRVRTVKTLKRGDQASGYLVATTTRKCRLFPPHRTVTWVLDFERGPSPELTLFYALIDARVIKRDGKTYSVSWSKEKFLRKDWIAFLSFGDNRATAEQHYLMHLRGELETTDDEDEGSA